MTDAASLIPWLVVLPVVALAIGWFVGRRRVHELELELAQARAAIQTDEALVQEREQALELAAMRVRAGFDAAATEALRGNSEVFLQMARQALAQQQQLAERQLTEREKAVETMLAPVREALQRTHEQIA